MPKEIACLADTTTGSEASISATPTSYRRFTHPRVRLSRLAWREYRVAGRWSAGMSRMAVEVPYASSKRLEAALASAGWPLALDVKSICACK